MTRAIPYIVAAAAVGVALLPHWNPVDYPSGGATYSVALDGGRVELAYSPPGAAYMAENWYLHIPFAHGLLLAAVGLMVWRAWQRRAARRPGFSVAPVPREEWHSDGAKEGDAGTGGSRGDEAV